MKKLIALLLLTTANAFAALDCQELPSCESLGYICSAEECGEAKSLSCPFDQSKKICWPETKECEVGDILYNDFKCRNVHCGHTPIAIVADTNLRIAVAIDKGNGSKWGSIDTIDELQDCEDKTLVQESCATDGKANTLAIIEHKKNNPDMSYPPVEYCYNLTLGNLPIGSWWLPSVKELTHISSNIQTISIAMDKQGINFTCCWWSSNEKNYNTVYYIYINDHSVATVPKNGGYRAFCIIGY